MVDVHVISSLSRSIFMFISAKNQRSLARRLLCRWTSRWFCPTWSQSCRRICTSSGCLQRLGTKKTWDLSKRYLWSFVGTPAKTGICRVLALTNQKWDTMGIKQGYCGDQYHQQYNNIYIYMWFCHVLSKKRAFIGQILQF